MNKYILYILLIILIFIIISYIIINIFNTKYENFSQLVDDNFNLIKIKNSLNNDICNNNNCSIKYSTINTLYNENSLNKNLTNIIHINNKNQLVYFPYYNVPGKINLFNGKNLNITYVYFKAPFGIIATKSNLTNSNNIYFSCNSGIEWQELNIDLNNFDFDDNENLSINNINNLFKNIDYIIDNISLELNINNENNTHYLRLYLSTYGYKNTFNNNKNLYETETRLYTINIFSKNTSFDINNIWKYYNDIENINCKLIQYYYDANTDLDNLKYKKIKKLITFNRSLLSNKIKTLDFDSDDYPKTNIINTFIILLMENKHNNNNENNILFINDYKNGKSKNKYYTINFKKNIKDIYLASTFNDIYFYINSIIILFDDNKFGIMDLLNIHNTFVHLKIYHNDINNFDNDINTININQIYNTIKSNIDTNKYILEKWTNNSGIYSLTNILKILSNFILNIFDFTTINTDGIKFINTTNINYNNHNFNNIINYNNIQYDDNFNLIKKKNRYTFNIISNTNNIYEIDYYDIVSELYKDYSKPITNNYLYQQFIQYNDNNININNLYTKNINFIKQQFDTINNNIGIIIKFNKSKLINYPKDKLKFIEDISTFTSYPEYDNENTRFYIIRDNKKIYIKNIKFESNNVTPVESPLYEITNVSKQYNDYRIFEFINKLNNTTKITFKGDNNIKHKIYIIEFKKDKYISVLAVGGGGGGGAGGGGGGGGDVKYIKNHKFSKGKYRIIVGSGGKGGNTNNKGAYGENTEIEQIEGDNKFNKIIVAGGGGGASFITSDIKTPISGIIGDLSYSSGGGGGGGGKDGIGGIGNGISGNGGLSKDNNGNIYGGGGGGGGNIYNIYNDKEIGEDNFKMLMDNDNNRKFYQNNGTNATDNNYGLGGNGIVILTPYYIPKSIIDDDIKSLSKGGNGGYYGKFPDNNNIIHNLNLSNKENIPGAGGNGGIIITNKDFDYDLNLMNGNAGIVILFGGKNDKLFDNENDINNEKIDDTLLNNYSLIDRDLNDENKKAIKEYQNMLKELLLNKKNNKIEQIKKNKENNNINKKNNIYELESISNKRAMDIKNFKEDSINDPISDAYLPYYNTLNKNIDLSDPENSINKYKIIKLYKELLNRQPTNDELLDNNRKINNNILDFIKLRRLIINSDEYSQLSKLQNNITNSDLIYSTTKNNILHRIAELYNQELDEEIPRVLLNPLKDILNYFQYNEYLFRAMLINFNFNDFKDELIKDKTINKNKILEVFNKYFVLHELKSKANDIQKYDKFNKKDNNNNNINEVNTVFKYQNYLDNELSDNNIDFKNLNLENLILKGDYNYKLWNSENYIETTEDKTNLVHKLNELKEMRNDINSSASEHFTNFKKNENFKNNNLINNNTYIKMNNIFTNKF
tara:strand:- start:263 stop:4435 length:4173 start_codon:yes stop_codon:yes gene_type:complete